MDDQDFFQAVSAERARQDKQWGGAEHDDTHDVIDWARFMDYQLNQMVMFPDTARERLIKVAALALAAAESLGRTQANVVR